ncbi:MAG: hypothetical protein AAFW70_10420 [Cyanobacteria bacterium J06635_10]
MLSCFYSFADEAADRGDTIYEHNARALNSPAANNELPLTNYLLLISP